ncbi:MAG: DUF721 domain-containing protein [Flavobacteriales bacterium]|nr:DUF721 domain-containing protein [Flavobacteriales bacterium]
MYKKKSVFGYRRNEPISLKDGLKNIYSEYKLEDNLDLVEITNKWEEIMGKAISNKTTSIQMYNGTLRISLNSSVLKQELNYAKDKIRTHLNEALGKEVIKDVILI